jgi:hypothetical protein
VERPQPGEVPRWVSLLTIERSGLVCLCLYLYLYLYLSVFVFAEIVFRSSEIKVSLNPDAPTYNNRATQWRQTHPHPT